MKSYDCMEKFRRDKSCFFRVNFYGFVFIIFHYLIFMVFHNNNNNNNNNNNESLFHQKILHILCYNNTEDKKTMIKISTYTYIY